MAANANRVIRGVKVQHPCGDPNLPEQADRALGLKLVQTAMRALETPVTGPTMFEPSEPVKEAGDAS